jgi:hypothetical protein
MFFIAAALRERCDEGIMSSLNKLIGSSGIGNAFEITAHAKLLASSECHCCLGVDGILAHLPLGGRRKVLIRTSSDISFLKVGQYGFPTICNFPLVDAVLPPDIALNMTIGKSHRGAVSKLTEIACAMRISLNQLKMVFVVPEDMIGNFQFPGDLGDALLFLTTPSDITEDALAALRTINKISKSRSSK